MVPYAAGGGNDVMARIVAEKMSKSLGQQIVIENKGGAGGSIATRQVAKAAPDGYTLGLGGTGTLAINPTLYPNVGYDPRKDFAPVGLIATIGARGAGASGRRGEIDSRTDRTGEARPGQAQLRVGRRGQRHSSRHRAARHMAGIKLTHIPYKGSSPALTDLLGGHVAIYFSSLPPAISLVKEGKVRALGVTGPKRSAVFPDLPAVAETLPGYEAVLHYGIVAPAGTASADHRKTQRGAHRGACRTRGARAHRGGRRRGDGDDARRICRRHRR